MRALSLLPVAYVVLGLTYVGAGGSTGWPFAVVAGTAMLACVYLVVASIVHIVRNPGLNEHERLTWLLLALLMGFIVLPVYWFSIARRTPPRRLSART